MPTPKKPAKPKKAAPKKEAPKKVAPKSFPELKAQFFADIAANPSDQVAIKAKYMKDRKALRKAKIAANK